VRLRVTAAAVLLVAIALGVAGIGASRLLHHTLASDYDAVLADRIDEVELLAAEGALEPILPATGRETGQLQVFDLDHRLIAATLGLAESARLDVIQAPVMGRQTSGNVDGARIGGAKGETFHIVARTVPSGLGPLVIYGATSLRTAEQAQHHFTDVLLVGLPILVLLAAPLIWWVVGRALAPVEQLREVVDQIEATDLTRRVPTGRERDEIGRLATTLNRMLGRLDEAGRRQRLFAAAASHELRSPLSAIRTELEVGRTYPDRTDWDQVAAEALIEVERLERLAADLLVLTRLDADIAGRRDPGVCDLGALVAAEVDRRIAPAGVTYEVDVRRADVHGDREALVRLVRNLLDNADRHAHSVVDVTVRRSNDVVTMTVANDGSAIAAADRERIFEPFTRLDDARSIDSGGSGLGLAIARRIAAAHGGTLLASDPPSGASFEATFPAAN
jgi:signal transduction histidine kinase